MKIDDDAKFALGVASFILLAISLIIAVDNDHSQGGCKYRSLISFFPTRILFCELVRTRWP